MSARANRLGGRTNNKTIGNAVVDHIFSDGSSHEVSSFRLSVKMEDRELSDLVMDNCQGGFENRC